MINPTVKDIQNLNYKAYVLIEIGSEKCGIHFKGYPKPETISKSLIGKVFYARRTGSHSMQPRPGQKINCCNIYADNISAIYFKEIYPEKYI